MLVGVLGFLGVIVFGIMSLISLFKKNGKTKRNFIITGICFVLFIGGAVNSSDSNESDKNTKDEKSVETTADKEDKTENQDDKESNKEKKKEKEEEQDKKPKKEKKKKENKVDIAKKIQDDSLHVDKATLKDGVLTLEKEPSSSWSENTLVKNNVYSLFESVNDGFKDKDVNKVEVKVHAVMIDEKGNEKEEPVIEYEYDRDTFEELNYDNFIKLAVSESWRILNESDEYLVHPGIYKDVKQDYKQNLKHNGMKIRE